MEKEQVIILEDRGLISVSGEDTKDFLQNILTNDIDKVNEILCPASKEAGQRTTCDSCKLCGGLATKTKKSSAIVWH